MTKSHKISDLGYFEGDFGSPKLDHILGQKFFNHSTKALFGLYEKNIKYIEFMDSNSEQKYLSPTNNLSTFRVLYSKK